MQWIEELANDLGYAVRLLRRSPGFTTMAVASLALGIGANTAIFTLLNAVMVRPLPVRSPDELVTVGDPARPTGLREGGPMLDILSYPFTSGCAITIACSRACSPLDAPDESR